MQLLVHRDIVDACVGARVGNEHKSRFDENSDAVSHCCPDAYRHVEFLHAAADARAGDGRDVSEIDADSDANIALIGTGARTRIEAHPADRAQMQFRPIMGGAAPPAVGAVQRVARYETRREPGGASGGDHQLCRFAHRCMTAVKDLVRREDRVGAATLDRDGMRHDAVQAVRALERVGAPRLSRQVECNLTGHRGGTRTRKEHRRQGLVRAFYHPRHVLCQHLTPHSD